MPQRRPVGQNRPSGTQVNPDVDAGTHEKISTGKAENKFIVPMPSSLRSCSWLTGLEPCAIDIHIGSQITDLGPFRTAFEKTADLLARLRAKAAITSLIWAVGWGAYQRNNETPTRWLMRASLRKILPIAARIILEPGRLIAANAGILVTRVAGKRVRPKIS